MEFRIAPADQVAFTVTKSWDQQALCGQPCAQFWHNHGVIHRRWPKRKVVVCRGACFVRTAAQGSGTRKYAPLLDKTGLSTQNAALYYYCYLSIKIKKNNQNPNFPAPRLARCMAA